MALLIRRLAGITGFFDPVLRFCVLFLTAGDFLEVRAGFFFTTDFFTFLANFLRLMK
jgi:hypothetical protein